MNQVESIRPFINFRDLGGYTCQDGRKIKNGYFYRSARLIDLNEEEWKILENLNLKTIYDFRSHHEISEKPDPYLKGVKLVEYSAILNPDGSEVDFSPTGIFDEMVYSRENNREFTQKVYGTLPFSPAFKAFMNDIVNHEVPILFHCTAGKDRTGIAASILLLALGVSEQTIIEDYLLTNQYRAELIEDFLQKFPAKTQDEEESEILLSFEGVSARNIIYSLQQIKNQYSSYENYLKEVFSLGEKELSQLRDKYTI